MLARNIRLNRYQRKYKHGLSVYPVQECSFLTDGPGSTFRPCDFPRIYDFRWDLVFRGIYTYIHIVNVWLICLGRDNGEFDQLLSILTMYDYAPWSSSYAGFLLVWMQRKGGKEGKKYVTHIAKIVWVLFKDVTIEVALRDNAPRVFSLLLHAISPFLSHSL